MYWPYNLFISVAVQLMYSGEMAESCSLGGDGCGVFEWCCSGYSCTDTLHGGVCKSGKASQFVTHILILYKYIFY